MDPKVRKDVLRKLTYGLHVITTAHDGRMAAAAISWLSQCSFEPPLVMIGLRRDGTLCGVLGESGRAVVHVVGRGQEALGKAFFGPLKADTAAATLNGQAYHLEDGLPVLDAAGCRFGIAVRQWVELGDHAVCVAEITGADLPAADFAPLALSETPWSYGG